MMIPKNTGAVSDKESIYSALAVTCHSKAGHGRLIATGDRSTPVQRLVYSVIVVMGISIVAVPQRLQAAEDMSASRDKHMEEESGGKSRGVDDLVDVTNRVNVAVTIAREAFENESVYDVTIKNQSADALDGDFLVLVLDQLADIAGKDALDRMEIINSDGQTSDGRPYYKVSVGEARVLEPYGISEPTTVRLRNVALTLMVRPMFRVFGTVRDVVPQSVNDLITLLFQKGILSRAEVMSLMHQ